MKISNRIVAFILIALVVSSCTDTLDLENPNEITTENFWESKDDVEKALAATYHMLQGDMGYWGVRGIEISNIRGDDFLIRNDVSNLYEISTFTNIPENGILEDIWGDFYRGIFRANQIIEETPEISSIDEEDKKQLIAEAKFLRALNFFNLTINFENVPMPLASPENQDDYYKKNVSQDSIYQQIFSDLQDAAEDLPVSYSSDEVGRATKGAAIGYLGKSYLYHEDWEKAEEEFEKLMSSPFDYDLMDNYADNFDLEHENNQESVFEIQLQDVDVNNNLGVTTAQEFAPSAVSGWYEVHPTDKLYEAFQKEVTVSGDYDPRMVATIVWEGQEGEFYQRPISEFFPSDYGVKSRIKKYQNWQQESEQNGLGGTANSSSINERAIRFADVLLMHAEAVTRQGRPGDAYDNVNRIRNRAKLSDLPSGYSLEEMMAEIRHQRMIEFAREGLRFYDLKRWGLLEEEIENSDKPGKGSFKMDEHKYFPLPQGEVDANPEIN